MSSESTQVDATPATEAEGKSPLTWVPTLYFAEGLPNVVTVVVSVLMYKSMGLSDGDIAFFTGMITLPWAAKPLWSPLLELVRSQKSAVIATQILSGAAFGCIALALPTDNFLSITLALFALLAFNSATHDIAADGIYVQALDSKRQAQFVGVQGAAYNIARFLAQGGFVILAGKLEKAWGVSPAWMAVMAVFGIMMLLLGAWHAKTLPAPPHSADAGSSLSDAVDTFGKVLKTFFQKKNVWWAIAFTCLFRFSEGMQVKVVPLFFRASREAGGLAFDTEAVGWAYGVAGPLAFVAGSLAGGWLTSRRGLKRSLLILCAMFNVPNVMYALLAFTQPESTTPVIGAVLLETFGYGFGFVGLPLFIMQEVAPGPYKTAHYAVGTGLMFLGFTVSSMGSGYISDFLGYKMHFLWVLCATIPSFLVAWKVPILNDPGAQPTAN